MGIGWSIHRNGGYKGQFERIGRWHKRIHSAANRGSSDLEDFLFAFFQNCYHLREWILKTSSASQSELDQLFEGSRELRVCRDICNGTKHLTISHASVDPEFSIGREYDPSVPAGFRYFVLAGGDIAKKGKEPHFVESEKVDLLSLADQCFSVWKIFLSTIPANEG